jgi:hypothetical protein
MQFNEGFDRPPPPGPELALSWNSVVEELRAGMVAVKAEDSANRP